MGAVGLLYVGAVLAINGLMLLGLVEAKSAAPLNLFVGGLQVLTPTFLIITSGGDPNVILGASGIYLFGFTYLYVGINLLAGLDGTGLGWFSAFVACCAVVYAALNFGRFDDPAFGVIWLVWAALWALFWVVLGLGRESLSRFTGAVALVAGILTAAIPAFLLLTGAWVEYTTTWAIVIAVAPWSSSAPSTRGCAAHLSPLSRRTSQRSRACRPRRPACRNPGHAQGRRPPSPPPPARPRGEPRSLTGPPERRARTLPDTGGSPWRHTSTAVPTAARGTCGCRWGPPAPRRTARPAERPRAGSSRRHCCPAPPPPSPPPVSARRPAGTRRR